MIRHLVSAVNVLRKGESVMDPVLWKNRTAATLAVAALIMALASFAKGFGYDLGVDNDLAMALAGGIAAAVGLYSNYATSKSVGILPELPGGPDDEFESPVRYGP
jgi:hypothetical protein